MLIIRQITRLLIDICFGYITWYLSVVEIKQYDNFLNLNYFKFTHRLSSRMLKILYFLVSLKS